MSVQTDIDAAMTSLGSAISAYTAANGSAVLLAQWLVNQIKQADLRVARALDQGVTRFVAEQPDKRPFASIG
ncbi:hypothetical protein JQ615_18085 [Bradyrhizobium jicamae]|uniref:Uncharacterized protein n=1 Tax=Bradyrhizobium jicamae TaxID=280332 RepID=A0ABS5FKJ4_9BRAD|nr:hypothetical protein [Bradyrhizobium jicamae]MBR0797301.1 hypothetical protein [Bradyrhizobium jicamae]